MARAKSDPPKQPTVPFAKLSQKAKDAKLAEILGGWYEAGCAKQTAEALAGGADPNAKIDGKTAIQRISGHGDFPSLFKALIAAGGDPRAKTKTGDTPPHLAARHGYAKSLAVFLDSGVPLDFRDGNGNTLLHRAAGDGYNGSDQTVALLLKRGADPLAKNAAGKTVIDVAARDHKDRMLKLISKPLSAKAKALLAAVAKNDAKKVAKALADGADPCEVDSTSGKQWGDSGLDGVAAIHVAFARGVDREIVELLLAHRGLDVNVKSTSGQTALHVVVQFGRGADRAALVDKLIALGADVNATDDRGETPIFGATSFYKLDGELELVDTLLAAGASKTVVDSYGETALDQMLERTQRFHEINDKPGFVAMMTKLVGLKFKTKYGKELAAWLKVKGAKYAPKGGASSPPKPKPTKPSKERVLFDKLTGGTLHTLVGKETTLELAGKRRPVALFDFFVYAAEQREDQSNYLEQIAEYHLDEDALDKVGNRQWIPIGIVGMNGTIESYQEIGVDGTLYLDLSKAKGTDAPVVFATQSYMGLSPAKPLKPGALTYKKLFATLKPVAKAKR
jgi:ankyrin repeat protein